MAKIERNRYSNASHGRSVTWWNKAIQQVQWASSSKIPLLSDRSCAVAIAEAAHQLHEKALEIVLKAGADIKAKSQDKGAQGTMSLNGFTASSICKWKVFSTSLYELGDLWDFMRFLWDFYEILWNVEACWSYIHAFPRCPWIETWFTCSAILNRSEQDGYTARQILQANVQALLSFPDFLWHRLLFTFFSWLGILFSWHLIS